MSPIRLDRTASGASESPGEPIRHVYMHAPFCARRCVYCDFAVTVNRAPLLAPWLVAVGSELAAIERERTFGLADQLSTVYVGGGTPSLLGPNAMQGVADTIGPSRLAGADLEWTAEANPESFSPDVAQAWVGAGVNRISIGVQSFHAAALSWMGRLHGPRGGSKAMSTARTAGLTDIGIDLIFGLPRHLGRNWEIDLETALELRPAHLSLYGLTIEGTTALGRAVSEGREPPVDETQYREEYLLASERLTEAGYDHYEVSNFALPGHTSRHNSAYWSGVPYLGLGNGAHSYRDPLRRWNLRGWADYQDRTSTGDLPVMESETLSIGARRLERVWLDLRTRSGIDAASLPAAATELCERWVLKGFAVREAGRIRLTPEGWLLLDGLTVALDDVLSTESNDGTARATETTHRQGRSRTTGIDV